MFSSKVTWPVCTEEDQTIGWSDIVSNQPPVSVDKHTEQAQCHLLLIHPRITNRFAFGAERRKTARTGEPPYYSPSTLIRCRSLVSGDVPMLMTPATWKTQEAPRTARDTAAMSQMSPSIDTVGIVVS